MSKIGIIGAMEIEVRSLKAEMTDVKETQRAGMVFFEGKLNQKDVVVVRSGVGKVNAAVCVQILADTFQVTHIINTGAAGSLNENLHIGDILVSVDVMHHDVDATLFGYQLGEVPQLGTAAFVADEELIQIAMTVGDEFSEDAKIMTGRIVSGDQFIADGAKKAFIRENFHGDGCEMEGSAVAQTAFLNKIPFVVIRAISDNADKDDHRFADYDAFEKAAAKRSALLVKKMLSKI